MFEGTEIRGDIGETYDTRNLVFILTGAFNEVRRLDENKEKRMGSFGFGEASKTDEELRLEETRKRIYGGNGTFVNEQSKLIEIGMLPEIVGRITEIVHLDELTEAQVFTALMNPEGQFLKSKMALLGAYGMQLRINQNFVRDLVACGMADHIGVRGCRNLLEKAFEGAVYKAFETGKKFVIVEYPEGSKPSGRSSAAKKSARKESKSRADSTGIVA